MSKKVEVISMKIEVRLNLTADDWQLYSDLAGRDKAAEGLNRGIERLLAAGNPEAYETVLRQYGKWGAMDSEGYYVVEQIYDRVGLNGRQYI